MNLFYIPFTFYYRQQILFTLRASSLLSILIDIFLDIIEDECSFQFSPEAELPSLLYVYITFATDTEAESS